MKSEKVPVFHELMNPIIGALHDLGGSGSPREIENKVVELEKIPDGIAEIQHGNGSRTEVGYRIAWALTYLKRYGTLENSTVGIWSFRPDKNNIKTVNPKQVVNFYKKSINIVPESAAEDVGFDSEVWREELITAIQGLSSSAFEILCKRILRESGVDQVVVTGRSNDGGIDGQGILKIAGLISFNVKFQCKKWKNAVPPKEIRDFGGSLRGRNAKGIFISTSTFTKSAKQEATREGAEIDLIDGSALVDKIKYLGLGLKITTVEKIEIDQDWFDNLATRE